MDKQKDWSLIESLGESLDDISVYELPGVGPTLGRRLFNNKYRVAADVYKEYVNFNKDPLRFYDWLHDICNSSLMNSERCYNFFKHYEEIFGDYKDVKETDTNTVKSKRLDLAEFHLVTQFKETFGEGIGLDSPPQQKLQQNKTTQQNECDNLIKFFFLKMKEVLKLPSPQQLLVKRKINQIVYNAKEISESTMPFCISDSNGDKKTHIKVKSLCDLIVKASKILEINDKSLSVVLDCDGTKVDDEEYFSSLDPGTALMILQGEEKWRLPRLRRSLDQIDNIDCKEPAEDSELVNLVSHLLQDIHYICLLNDRELEMLSEMDPEKIADSLNNGRDNLVHLKRIRDACENLIQEKREAKDALDLLQIYHKAKSAKKYVT